MSRGFVRIALAAALCFVNATAWAGPVELLNKVSINASDPNHIVVSYIYGGNGMFVSADGGKTLKWICQAAMTPTAPRGGIVQLGGDGAIYLGSYSGLMRGDQNGCGFQPVPELDKQYIGAISGDPIDPKRTYIATTTAKADNGIYMNDGSGTFTPLGARAPRFIDTLDVVKVGDKRRFYETTVLTNVETNTASYFVQTSDDEGATWAEEPVDLALFPPIEMYSDFNIAAVNPANPDQVVGVIKRTQNVDSIIYSDQKGKAGSWKQIAEVTELGGAAFTPDGALYLGDNGQKTKGLTVVAKPGDEPRKLNEAMRVSCLAYEPSSARLLGCANNYLFGAFDLSSGVLAPLLDLRCATDAVECEGWTGPAPICKPDTAEFCRFDHWVVAPLCLAYDRGEECALFASSQTVACVNGRGVDKETPETIIPGAADTCATVAQMTSSAGAAGASTSQAGAGSSGSAGGAGTSGSGVAQTPNAAGGASKAPKGSSGGCQSVAAGGGANNEASAAYFSLMGLALIMLRGRRPSTRSMVRSR